MKEFWVYTLLRIGLFLGSLAIVFGVWFAITGDVPVWLAVVVAFAISGVASYVLLGQQREAFARRVAGPADRVARRYDQARSKEDVD